MRFYEENPRTFAAFMSAFNEANAFIKQDPKTAAEIYLRVTREKIPVDVIQGMLSDPEIQYTTTPRGVQKYLDFMFKVGTIKEKAKWEDLFFPDYHYPGGS
jgi:NitT/TauT family transport system substrate-binding protein